MYMIYFLYMEILLIVIGVVVIVLLSLILLKQYKKEEVVEDKSFMILQDQLERMTRVMDDRLHRSQSELHQVLHRQDSEAKKLITEITKELTEVKEGNKQVFSMTEQLQNLEKVLTHQKQRGNLGEASLELILSNMLAPGQYEMQYRFKTGEVVDAIIQTKDGFIPIDAKYSLDNYQRLMNAEGDDDTAYFQNEFKKDIQKRIDETAKYIKPDEGTLPFAFMFIPAEGIYYDLLVNEVGSVKVNTRSLIDYAYKDKKVIIVSPTTFAAYLQSVLYGFKAYKVEKNAKKIEENVNQLMKHLGAYEEYFKKIGVTLSTVVNHYNSADKELKKVEKDMFKITGESNEYELDELEKPRLLEQ